MAEQSVPINQQGFYTKSQLKEKGWTKGLIEKFLPEPDKTKKNPHYRSGPPMQLYLSEKVEQVESTAEFGEAKEKASKRQESARKAAKTRRANLSKWRRDLIRDMQLNLPRYSHEVLRDLAINDYNAELERRERRRQERLDRRMLRGMEWQEDYHDDVEQEASPLSDAKFLSRITVNYARHSLTNYDDVLEELESKLGTEKDFLYLRQRVYAAIAEAYPWLKEECDRQLRDRR